MALHWRLRGHDSLVSFRKLVGTGVSKIFKTYLHAFNIDAWPNSTKYKLCCYWLLKMAVNTVDISLLILLRGCSFVLQFH